MYCPQCGVEYRHGYTSCSDCQVLLVHERPRRTSAEASVEPGDPNRDPFCAFWQGTDSRTLAELCAVLEEAGIPQRTVRREDRLFNRMDQPKLLVGVPASLYEKAEEVVGAAFSERPLLSDTAGFIPEGLEKAVDFDQDAAAMELEDSPLYSNATRAGRTEILCEWYPADATVEVWKGNSSEDGAMLEMSLGENEIRYRKEIQDENQSLFVFPEDESRAREIIRQILEASPPE